MMILIVWVESSENMRNNMTEFLLCLFLGFLGVHKFYRGENKMGVIYALTLGLFGLGWIIDIIILFIKLFTSKPEEEIDIPIITSTDSEKDKSYNDFKFNQDKFKRRDALLKEYKPYLDKHERLVDEINEKYSIAYNLTGYHSPEMEYVIDLCYQDIELAPMIKEFQIEMNRIFHENEEDRKLPQYQSFSRLAIIYEKQGNFEKGIEICNIALRLGYTRDGTQGGMRGRMARLIRKNNNQVEKIEIKQER